MICIALMTGESIELQQGEGIGYRVFLVIAGDLYVLHAVLRLGSPYSAETQVTYC